MINKTTLDINYSSFYQWESKASKLNDLASAAQKYFIANSPFVNKDSKLLDERLSKIQDNITKPLEQINVTELYNKLSYDPLTPDKMKKIRSTQEI